MGRFFSSSVLRKIYTHYNTFPGGPVIFPTLWTSMHFRREWNLQALKGFQLHRSEDAHFYKDQFLDSSHNKHNVESILLIIAINTRTHNCLLITVNYNWRVTQDILTGHQAVSEQYLLAFDPPPFFLPLCQSGLLQLELPTDCHEKVVVHSWLTLTSGLFSLREKLSRCSLWHKVKSFFSTTVEIFLTHLDVQSPQFTSL